MQLRAEGESRMRLKDGGFLEETKKKTENQSHISKSIAKPLEKPKKKQKEKNKDLPNPDQAAPDTRIPP